MQATLLDCIAIGRSKFDNSTNRSIAILLKFTYNVKNRKLFYHRFVEPSECTKRPKLVRVCTVIKSANRTQSAFKAQFIYRTFRRLLRVATSLQLFIFFCCDKLKIYIIVCRASSSGPSHSEKIKLYSQEFLITSDRTLTYFFFIKLVITTLRACSITNSSKTIGFFFNRFLD